MLIDVKLFAVLALALYVDLAAGAVTGSDVFIGCYPETSLQVLAVAPSSSGMLCAGVCARSGSGYYYSAYAASTCICSYNAPSGGPDSGNINACTNGDYDVRYLDAPQGGNPQEDPDFFGCGSVSYPTNSANTNSNASPTPIDTIAECFAFCQSSGGYQFVSYDYGVRICSCNSVLSSTSAECGLYEYFIYGYPTSLNGQFGASSALTRRHLEAKRRKERKFKELCPTDMVACKVAQDSPESEYECLDISSELYSCGGCLYGAVGSANSTVGQDCTLTDNGALMGGVTCLDGTCVVSACESGFVLEDGRCVDERA